MKDITNRITQAYTIGAPPNISNEPIIRLNPMNLTIYISSAITSEPSGISKSDTSHSLYGASIANSIALSISYSDIW